jgi:adenosylhomocysteine nucleosidase
MDVRALGFELGQTPFEDLPTRLEFPEVFASLPHGTCASADRFDTGQEGLSREVIDMEAFALAKVCLLENIPFACAKYISDGADDNAPSDWQTSLRHAAIEFRKLYEALCAPALLE